jgi:hypothetical protein
MIKILQHPKSLVKPIGDKNAESKSARKPTPVNDVIITGKEIQHHDV